MHGAHAAAGIFALINVLAMTPALGQTYRIVDLDADARAASVNDLNEVAGSVARGGEGKPAIWRNGAWHWYGFRDDKSWGDATDLGRKGDMVGYELPPHGQRIPSYFDKDSKKGLRIPHPGESKESYPDRVGISPDGKPHVIVGRAAYNGESHAFMLLPQ